MHACFGACAMYETRLQESSDLNTKMFLPEASAVRAPCTKCKKAKKGIVLVCVRVCIHGRCRLQVLSCHDEARSHRGCAGGAQESRAGLNCLWSCLVDGIHTGEGAEGISDKEAADQESNQEEGGEGSVAVHCCIQALMPACIDDV